MTADTESSENGGVLGTLSHDMAEAVERGGRATVAIHARKRIPSSGVHWRAGVIVAANHTVKRDDDVTITLHDGTSVRATVAGRDPTTDIVVLRADANAATVADHATDALRVGQLVLALGRPGPSVTASWGIVSALGGEWRTWQGGRVDRFVRLDLAIYDGFSGGPLVDTAGRVVGLNTSGLSRSAALALPAETVNRVADQLLAGGRVSRGYLGIGTQPVRLPDALRERMQHAQSEVGLMIVSLEPGGPGDASGLLLGDVLLALDGAGVADASDVMAALGAERVGQPVRATVLRAGEVTEVAVTVGEHPGPRRG